MPQSSEEKGKIAVIGAGFMGPGIGQVFATCGYPVQIYNRNPGRLETVHDRVRQNLSQMAEYGLVDADSIPSIIGRISTTTDLEEACSGTSIVFEEHSGSLEQKQALFADRGIAFASQYYL